MRVLVYPHTMILSGVLNAVELAAAVRDRGHEVIVLSRPGPMVTMVRQLDLEHVPLDPRAKRMPSPLAAAQLASLAKKRKIDVVHGWEWPSAVEAFAGARLVLGIPVVCTVVSMSVAPFLPRTIPLIVGSEEIAENATAAGHASVRLIEPPVDAKANAPGFDAGSFRTDFGLGPATLLVVVCRLARELKLEGLLSACDAVGKMADSGMKIQLAIVGDGPARQQVEEAAAAANAAAGRQVVVLAGAMYDPRPAYAAADIVLGMGGSALRGMAFGKPLIVQGEHGFWELASAQTAPLFLHQGWYGVGPAGQGRAAGAMRLEEIVRGLWDDSAAQTRLGKFGRDLVVSRYSLDRAGLLQEEAYASAIEQLKRPSAVQLAADAVHTGVGVMRHKGSRKWHEWRGKPLPEDDFNAVAAAKASTRGAQ
ncbi:MAG: glycosyltransferase [Streptosporangiaceae bacterium]